MEKAMKPLLCCFVLALAACSVGEDVVQMAARESAKRVVNDVIAQRFPGVDAAPYTDCIVDNATNDEIISLAQNAVTGANAEAANTVLGIAARPTTSQCLARSAVGPVGALLMAG